MGASKDMKFPYLMKSLCRSCHLEETCLRQKPTRKASMCRERQTLLKALCEHLDQPLLRALQTSEPILFLFCLSYYRWVFWHLQHLSRDYLQWSLSPHQPVIPPSGSFLGRSASLPGA